MNRKNRQNVATDDRRTFTDKDISLVAFMREVNRSFSLLYLAFGIVCGISKRCLIAAVYLQSAE